MQPQTPFVPHQPEETKQLNRNQWEPKPKANIKELLACLPAPQHTHVVTDEQIAAIEQSILAASNEIASKRQEDL
jgi:hypothetical protein